MKTFFKFAMFILCQTYLTTQAAEFNLVGSWKLAQAIPTKTGSLNLEINILQNLMELKATCEFQPKFGETLPPDYLSTSLTTAIELSSVDIKILEEHTSNSEDGIKSCRSHVEPTTWNYSISEDGNQLVVDAIVPYMQRLFFVRK